MNPQGSLYVRIAIPCPPATNRRARTPQDMRVPTRRTNPGPAPAGPRPSPTPVSAQPSLTGSPSAATSSKRVRTPTASPPPEHAPKSEQPADRLLFEPTPSSVRRSLVFPTGSAHASPVTGRDQNRTTPSQERQRSTGHPWSVHRDEPAGRTVRNAAPIASRSRRPRLPGMDSGAPSMARPRPRPRAGNHPLAGRARANTATGRGLDDDSQGTP